MSFKKTKVVMLPTNEKATIGSNVLVKSNTTLAYGKKVKESSMYFETEQHIYFLSDDKIKNSDWCYDEYNKVVFQNNSFGTPGASKKIIATTDKSLVVSKDTGIVGIEYNLPEPSEGFIQKFVDSYNSGNQISEVDVEYNHLLTTFGVDEESLKINPKDNTITIKKAKDTWSRNEVVDLLQQFNNDKSGVFDCTKWIEENL